MKFGHIALPAIARKVLKTISRALREAEYGHKIKWIFQEPATFKRIEGNPLSIGFDLGFRTWIVAADDSLHRVRVFRDIEEEPVFECVLRPKAVHAVLSYFDKFMSVEGAESPKTMHQLPGKKGKMLATVSDDLPSVSSAVSVRLNYRKITLREICERLKEVFGNKISWIDDSCEPTIHPNKHESKKAYTIKFTMLKNNWSVIVVEDADQVGVYANTEKNPVRTFTIGDETVDRVVKFFARDVWKLRR